MKKLKVVLMTLVVLVAVTGSLAAKKAAFCDSMPQFYKLGDSYIPAGVFGVDYVCMTNVPVTCTYWRPNPVTQPTTFQPCKWGCYFQINY